MRAPNTYCSVCGKPVYRRPSQIAAGPVFCCRRCFGQYSAHENKQCPQCQRKMAHGKKYCCRSCANEARKGIKYKTGKDARTISLEIRKSRGDLCQDCGYNKYPQILELHHKVRVADGGTDDEGNLLLLCPNCHAIRHRVEVLDIGASTGFENRHT